MPADDDIRKFAKYRSSRWLRRAAIILPSVVLFGLWLWWAIVAHARHKWYLDKKRSQDTSLMMLIVADNLRPMTSPCAALPMGQARTDVALFLDERLDLADEVFIGSAEPIDWVTGKILDEWHLPLYIVAVSTDCRHVQVISCGPNRKFENGLGDDIVRNGIIREPW